VSKEVSSPFAVSHSEKSGDGVSKSLLMIDPTTVDLEPEPIPKEWVLSGAPTARGKVLARSKDWTCSVVVWECTAGTFRWHYRQDETIVVISGEATQLKEDGTERRFCQGEVGFFPAGTTCTWRVDHHIRKVAVLRETLWTPVGMALKVWKKVLRMAGLTGKSSL